MTDVLDSLFKYYFKTTTHYNDAYHKDMYTSHYFQEWTPHLKRSSSKRYML